MKKIYKSLLGIVCGLGIISNINGQTVVTIGTGTASTTGVNYNPIYRSTAGSGFDFSRAYYLFDQTELTAAGIPSGATITQIEWDKSNTGATVASTAAVVFNILMKNSSATTYSTASTWGALSAGATAVYGTTAQVIPATTGFLPFNLSTSFVYTGGALEILTDWDISAVAGSPTTAGFAFNTSLVANRVGGNSNSVALNGTTAMATYGNRPNIRITFTPPPACSGMPTAGTVVASNTLFCTPQNVNLSLTGSTAASGLSYQWLSSPDGISWSPIPTATNIATTQSVTATTYYQCAVACGTDVATSSTITVNLGGTPNGGTAIASSSLACAGQTVGVNLTGASSIPGLAYQWQSSPDGSTWTSIPSATTSVLTQTYSSTVYYQAVLACASSTAASSSVQIDPNVFYNCYCFTAPTTQNTIDNIVNFALTNSLGSVLNQASSAVAPNFISYNNTPLDLVQGSASNTVAITMGSDGTQYGAAWIDFDRNGTYSITENIGLTATSVGGGAIVTYTFAVPAGASLGLTRIRVRGGSDNIYTTDACATSAYGETEEYLVNIVTPPSCLPPTSYINTALSTSSATFTWTAGGSETAWDVFVGSNPTGTTVPTATTSVTSYTATGLSPNTTYTINVRSNCGGVSSSWIALTIYTGYCTPAPSSVDNSGIVNVTIPTGINNNTGVEAGNYGDYSAQTANAFQGTPVNATITYSTGYTYDTKIWIDYNDDLDFNDVGEEVYSGTSSSVSPTTLNASFNVSLTAPLGTHRLRIGGVDAGPPTPCYTGTYGTFEDYSINIQPAPTCTLTPAIGSITGPSTLNIGTPGSFSVTTLAGNIQWYQGTSATGPWTAVTSATTNPSNITLNSQGTIFIAAIASNPGCVNDTTNSPWQVFVNFPGDNVCNAIPLSMGTSPLYSLFGATTQTGEVVPPATGFNTNTGWANSNITNSMWFTFVAPASGNVSIQAPTSMNAGNNDPQLAVWSTTNCANLIGQATPTAPVGATLIAANDDDANYTTNSGAQYSSYVRAACLTPGATYYIQLDTYTAASSGDATTIIITDLGAYDASFTGLAANYCLPTGSSSLTPVVTGGVFTINTSTASVTSFSASTAGTYTVTYNNVSTACMTSSTTIVNVTPSVMAMTSNTAVCAGSSATLTAGGATSYTWTAAGTSSTQVVTPSSASVYTVTGEASGCSNTATVSVGVNNLPTVSATASNTLVCSNLGESSVLTASTSATSYTWSDGANTMTTSVTPTVATTYTVTVNDGNCEATTTVFVDVQTCTGIQTIASVSNGINVYPNPTNGILNIAISSELAGNTSIEVYDALGKLVVKETLTNETTTINTSKLTDGMYVYKVINNNKAIKIGKIVKH